MQESRVKNKKRDSIAKRNQVVSVFALLIRSSFYKILAVLAAMIVGEIFSFRYVLLKSGEQRTQIPGGLEQFPSPEALIDDAGIRIFFLVTLGLVVMILAWAAVRMSEKAGYTMMRLHLSRKQLFAVKTVYHLICMVLLFVAQIWLGIWMICSYRKFVQLDQPAPQLLFMAFYRNEFLHCVLPMQEIGKWVRNILLILSLSMGCAGVIVYPGDKGNKYSAVSMLTILTLAWFNGSAGKNLMDMFCDLLYVGSIATELLKVYGVFGRSEAAREAENE